MPTCFVVMGFGKKTDFETGRVLDLDKSYNNIIKPAVSAAGLECVRADEIVHSGLIDIPMYEQLLNADVVVADLSTSNKNALYELGIRHALRPFTTIVIAEDGIKQFPFDINRVLIRQYHHLGEDIGYDEVIRFRAQLTTAIKDIMAKNPPASDSPVYTYINGLVPPELRREIKENIAEVENKPGRSHSAMMQQVDKAQQAGNWLAAKQLLTGVLDIMTADEHKQHEDPYIVQQLALSTYKSKYPTEREALLEAHDILKKLDPQTSNDTETLGLWGAIHKRLADIDKDRGYLDEAIRAYERGFYLRNDYYNGINYAFLLNVRADRHADRAEAIADFVTAMRVRKEVIAICNKWLNENPEPETTKAEDEAYKRYLANAYWVKATLAEAYIGVGDESRARALLDEAYKMLPPTWMKETTDKQITELGAYMNTSPLRYISEK